MCGSSGGCQGRKALPGVALVLGRPAEATEAPFHHSGRFVVGYAIGEFVSEWKYELVAAWASRNPDRGTFTNIQIFVEKSSNITMPGRTAPVFFSFTQKQILSLAAEAGQTCKAVKQ